MDFFLSFSITVEKQKPLIGNRNSDKNQPYNIVLDLRHVLVKAKKKTTKNYICYIVVFQNLSEL